MNYIYKQLVILLLGITTCYATETNEWKDITYIEHLNFKMRIEVFDPPIVLEWGKLASACPSDEIQKMAQCLAAKRYFSILDLTYNEWMKYCSDEYLDGFMDEKKYSKKKNMDLKRNFPEIAYQNLLYAINYLVDGKEYCVIASNTGSNPLTKTPKNMTAFREKHPVSGSLLIKIDGVWKNHSLPQKERNTSYRGLLEFANLDTLQEIEKSGFVIDGIEHPFVYAFHPSKSLLKAVGREQK